MIETMRRSESRKTDVDREAHEVRVHRARSRQEQARARRQLRDPHQPAEARGERARHAAMADGKAVGARKIHVVGHAKILARRAATEADPNGWFDPPLRGAESESSRLLNGACRSGAGFLRLCNFKREVGNARADFAQDWDRSSWRSSARMARARPSTRWSSASLVVGLTHHVSVCSVSRSMRFLGSCRWQAT